MSNGTVSRREFLAAGAALAAGSGLVSRARAGSARDADVVVVGAGAAGLAAAQTLLAAGLRVTVLEATGRTGGRAHTDMSLGVPFDLGCMYVSLAGNPLLEHPSWSRFTRARDLQDELEFIGPAGPVGPDAMAAFAAASTAFDQAVEENGKLGRDVAVTDLSYPGLDARARGWLPEAMAKHGQLDLGVDPDALSALDVDDIDAEGDTDLVREGYGRFISELGADVPVTLATPVRRIRIVPGGVEAVTDRGTVQAGAAIVTVSTGVLRDEQIRFEPGLPLATLRALDGLPMGMFLKVALRYAPGSVIEEVDPFVNLAPRVNGRVAALGLFRPFGAPLAVVLSGGSWGWELTGRGQDAAIEWAREVLVGLLGSRARNGIERGLLTGWGSDPWTRGSYAALRVGAHGARAALAQPIHERILLAGEALGEGQASFVHGAWQSGERAAARLLPLFGTTTR